MVNKRGAVILGGLFLFVLAVGLFFIFHMKFGSAVVPSSPLCFHKDDMPLYKDPSFPCSGMIEIGNYCCSAIGTVNSDYVCPSPYVSLNGECGNNVQFFRFFDAGGICCNECANNGCLDNSGSMCYGGFVVDASSETEVCNNKDDNCDGSVDEGNACDDCTYGGYGLMSYCSYNAFKVIDGENGEDFCSNYDNNYDMCNFYSEYCNYNSGLCNFDVSVCESKTNSKDCRVLHPLDGNDLCRWTSEQYTTNYENSICKDEWNINPLCEWNCYNCDINDPCCIQDGYDHIIGLLKDPLVSCPQTGSGNACKDGDVWSYKVNSYCDGLTSETCALEEVQWISLVQTCPGGCEDGVCISDTTPPTISISYPSNNQDIVNPWNHFEAKVTDNVDSTINCNYNIKRSDGSLVSGGFNENPISFTNNTLKYVGSGWNSDIDFVVSGLTFNLTCTDSAGNTASALRTGINVIEDKYANCASCTSDSQCESGHCAPLTPFGSNGLCVPVNTCSNYTGTSSCYVSSGATKCSDTDLYTCNPYSWTLTESNSVTCGAGSPTLKWKDPSTGNEISYAEITPEGIFPTVTLVLEDYSGTSVSFDIKERYNSNNYAIKTGVTQSGNYYYTWSLSQADLDKSPQTDGVNYTYYGYVSIGGQNYQTSSLKITDKRAVESTYCGDGIKQTPNDAGFNEQCDDGDNNGVIPSGIPCGTYVTYCGNTCTNQTVYGGDCPTGEPICGNGIVEDGEQCDDGNTNNGDGCSSTCQWEKDLYWTTTTNSKIGSKLTINASDLIGKRYRMWIEHSASDTTFDLWEYDALNSDDLLRTNLPGTLTTGNKRYYTWTLSNMDFTKTEKESTYKFYFIIDGENSRNYLPYGQLEIEVINGDAPRCDDGIQNGDETGIDCGGSCDACLETGPQFCSDYITKTTCENFDQEVADRSATPPAICEWTSETQTEGDYCIGTTLVSVNGIEIGRCQKTELLPRTQSCETSDFLNISWNENFVWGDSNDYSTRINCETANNVTTGCMESSGRWHYDPNSDSIKCSGTKSNVVPCPAQVRLSFFSWKNLVIAIIIIGLIYLSILEFRKNRSKVKKIEKEEKEQRQKDYKKSKRKVAKKKTVSKKRSVRKK